MTSEDILAKKDQSFNSFIKGQIVDVQDVMGESFPCNEHACFGRIAILEIDKKGKNYHGQYFKGDTLDVYFELSMSPTSKIFPELVKPLKGLKKGSIFRAELFEQPGSAIPNRIQLYAVEK